MEYSITLSDNGRYIILKVKGDLDRLSSLRKIIQAHELGAKLGIDRYMADLTEARSIRSVLDDYQLANDDTHNDPRINTYALIAMLVSPDEHSHDFFEIAAINAGWCVKLFRDGQSAHDFLTEDKHSISNLSVHKAGD